MDKYTLTKYDFKKYLLATLKDVRQEDLILWKKSIPLPVDLVHRIFDEGETLIIIYCHHIIGISVLTQYYTKREENLSVLDNYPFKNVIDEIKNIDIIFNEFVETTKTTRLLEELGKVFNMNLSSPTINDFINSISHDGRKYKRLYIPKLLKNKIVLIHPELLTHIGVSNGDMFGNVVADYLQIYRSGFSDAFAAVFNKLLDFFIEYQVATIELQTKRARIEIKQIKKDVEKYAIIHERISDGALWEPRYENSRTITVVNEAHPYYSNVNEKNAQDILFEVMSKLSEMENNCVRESERRFYEMLRFELSRHLRLNSDY
jgi:hypothetical protein